MAALHAKKNHLNDCLILNTHNRICESTVGNIFCIQDKIISTPALSEGCVAGVMRKFLLNNLKENEFVINETQITIENAKNADEIFLSNAMHGIRWIKRYDNKEYSNSITTEIYNKLIKNLS
jgi:branched-chain amino acid aminotransferase